MGQKLCPLSFFSFYINKETAQAGGSHECVEDACAIWDESCQQCHIKSGFEALSLIADVVGGINNISKQGNSGSPITDILSRLRAKKKITEETKVAEPLVNPPQEQKSEQITEPKSSVDVTTPPIIPISELPIVSLNELSNEVGNG